ncbi:MAG: hypothetical protein BWX88_04310 [Planctomycetes bacterium ADurb.Bin126]|nr:MAG: hypothetical protein BWX88_04310 [Planctomycetes bacterium ADurb.Bin126]HOD82981.1 hypothetical protein [Phycisphaerae bacterium]HQL75130.1 hypothetical protein [Phycisphaerae bacterium]
MTKTAFGIGIAALAVMGLAVGWAWAAGCGGCGGSGHAGHTMATAAKEDKAPAASAAHHLQALEDRITAALTAAQDGDAKTAAAELTKAKHLLAALKAELQPAGAPVNDRCPIMGGKVNPKLTRTFEGKTVGFCCPGCFPKWDNLTDAEKKAKLAAATTH